MKGQGQLHLSGNVSARVKHNFSRQHFSAAKFFTEECKALEDSLSDPSETEKSKLRAYVTGAVFSAVAALEASINELYLEAKDNNLNTLAGLSNSDILALTSDWDTTDVESREILEKYQNGLSTIDKPVFDKGGPPFQDVDSLVKLRNVLVHYKPEWDDEAREHGKLKSRLIGKFPLNPFALDSSLWFPHQCLAAGCSRWAIESTEKFMTEFCLRMGIPNRF